MLIRKRYKVTEEVKPQVSNITEVLAQRGSRYGKFTGHASITQDTKNLW